MIDYEITHQDTCLPDYWGGHHLPVLQVAVDADSTYGDVFNELLTWESYGHIQEDIYHPLYEAALQRLFQPVIDAGHMDNCPSDSLPEACDEDQFPDSVYMFFTLALHRSYEECLEHALELTLLEEWQELRDFYATVPFEAMLEAQKDEYPNTIVLTEDQVWQYIDHLPKRGNAEMYCKSAMRLTEQYKPRNLVYYILNGKEGHMGVRYGLEPQEYISGFDFGREFD